MLFGYWAVSPTETGRIDDGNRRANLPMVRNNNDDIRRFVHVRAITVSALFIIHGFRILPLYWNMNVTQTSIRCWLFHALQSHAPLSVFNAWSVWKNWITRLPRSWRFERMSAIWVITMLINFNNARYAFDGYRGNSRSESIGRIMQNVFGSKFMPEQSVDLLAIIHVSNGRWLGDFGRQLRRPWDRAWLWVVHKYVKRWWRSNLSILAPSIGVESGSHAESSME